MSGDFECGKKVIEFYRKFITKVKIRLTLRSPARGAFRHWHGLCCWHRQSSYLSSTGANMKLLELINPREIRRRLGLNQEEFWTRIGVTQSGASPLPGSFTKGWVTWDLTALAQGWVDGVITNNGILVKSNPTDLTYSVKFATRENNSAGGSHRPQLVVVYR